MDKDETIQEIENFIDILLPTLTPYETSGYIVLLRLTHLEGKDTVRIGKRTIAMKIGGSRAPHNISKASSYPQVTKLLKSLQEKGCLKIGDTNREGTLYTVTSPNSVPSVEEKLAMIEESVNPTIEDYFTNPEKRKEMFERDQYICFYCGEKVDEENVTLDHFMPQHLGGTHAQTNLRTACHMCNSIKSGKTYEEAIPFLLKSIQTRNRNASL